MRGTVDCQIAEMLGVLNKGAEVLLGISNNYDNVIEFRVDNMSSRESDEH